MQILKKPIKLNVIRQCFVNLNDIFEKFGDFVLDEDLSPLTEEGIDRSLEGDEEQRGVIKLKVCYLNRIFYISFNMEKEKGVLKFSVQLSHHGKIRVKIIFKEYFNTDGILENWRTGDDKPVDLNNKEHANLLLLNWIKRYFEDPHPVEYASLKHKPSE